MNRRNIYLFSGLVFLGFLIWIHFDATKKSENTMEVVKISLRDVGHQLLLSNQDSTSLVLPVKALSETKFKLSFDNSLSFDPGNLVTIVENSFEKTSLSKHYRVAVIQCLNNEIAYSYEMKYNKDSAIIPCRGRLLPDKCYTIQIRFIDKAMTMFGVKSLLYFLLFVVVVLLFVDYYKRKQNKLDIRNNGKCIDIGNIRFYPKQNKLLRGTVETNLSKKECELLLLFIAKPNQIIKREELTKKVWEDNGVFVSRSLDTYVSKLRKKLKDDNTIKIINVHGVGYKLETHS